MLLADLGADVIRVDRVEEAIGSPTSATRSDVLGRGKRSVAMDLKRPDGVALLLDLITTSDGLIEGFRPGVAERLGIGPAECLARNPALVFGRMTGWGQDGPYATEAGHDIDYIALSGALAAIGTADTPIPPLNLVGDFGGGGMLLSVGLLAAMLTARTTGVGQVVDAAMVDGSALLLASTYGYMADGWWTAHRESNYLDGGAPFYSVYETSDGRHVAVGALEPQFYANLLQGLGIAADELGPQNDRIGWPAMRRRFSEIFLARTRDDWEEHFLGSDACVAPVLTMEESPSHPHNASRGTFIEVDDVIQPRPAPRFSNTSSETPGAAPYVGRDTDEVAMSLGYTPDRIGKLRDDGAIA
jgi:alpha-methylacyl-CoA racemase